VRITKRIIAPVAVLGLGVLLVVTAAVFAPKPEKKDDIPRDVSAFVERAESKSLTLKVRTQGEVRPKTEVDLISQASGRIISVSPTFVAGGGVTPSGVLVQVDPTDYEFAVTSAEARVAEMMARFSRTQADADIVRRQWEKWGEGIPTDLALKKPEIAEATANLRAAQSSLAQARVNLSRTKISMPFYGRVREKLADVGQVVNSGSKLGRIFSTEIVEVKLPLSDSQLAQLNLPLAFEADESNAPKVTFTTMVAGKMHTWEGRLVRTAAAIDPQTRMVYATAEVVDPYGAAMSDGMPLAIGLFVNASIEGRNLDDALVIPRAALKTGDRVYVITADNRVSVRDVTVLMSDPDMVILVDGVIAGEMVAISPLRNVVDGMKVVAIGDAVSTAPVSVNAAQ